MEAAERPCAAAAEGRREERVLPAAPRDKLSFVCGRMSETPMEPFSSCARERGIWGSLCTFVGVIGEFLPLRECPERVKTQALAEPHTFLTFSVCSHSLSEFFLFFPAQGGGKPPAGGEVCSSERPLPQAGWFKALPCSLHSREEFALFEPL